MAGSCEPKSPLHFRPRPFASLPIVVFRDVCLVIIQLIFVSSPFNTFYVVKIYGTKTVKIKFTSLLYTLHVHNKEAMFINGLFCFLHFVELFSFSGVVDVFYLGLCRILFVAVRRDIMCFLAKWRCCVGVAFVSLKVKIIDWMGAETEGKNQHSNIQQQSVKRFSIFPRHEFGNSQIDESGGAANLAVEWKAL